MKYRKGSPMAVAGNRMAYRRTSDLTPMSFNHEITDNGAARSEDFRDFRKLIARLVLDTCLDLTPQQRQFFADIERDRYPDKWLGRFLEAVPHSANPFLLSEAIHAETVKRLGAPNLCPVESYLAETRAQAAADVAQARFVVERTPTMRDAAIEKLVQHMETIRVALNALHLWPRRRSA